jgi:phenylpropionate dioxygenase-like ring-hydroxylating dioxygenase large terminal subunit
MHTVRDILPPTTSGLEPPAKPLEDGWTLPARWYTDADVLRLEQERIFGRSWQYAARAAQVAEPGCFVTTRAGHVPVVVARARDGVLRGFVNVCRHRGHLVAAGEGCRETLQCPYHAWTYDLDGSLRRAPRAEREPGFRPEGFSLLPVAVDTWGPFVFVNPDPGAAPLAETLADLPGLVAESGIDLETLVFHSHHETRMRGNWKAALENYLECYHCPVAHPGFSRLIDVDPDEYLLRVRPTYLSQLGHARDDVLAGRRQAAYDPRGGVEQAQYHVLFPNTTINISPGFRNLSIERWLPEGADATVEVTDYFFAADAGDEQVADYLAFDAQVAAEDLALVASVQDGLESGLVPQGRLMRESEQLIAAFQGRIRDALLADA